MKRKGNIELLKIKKKKKDDTCKILTVEEREKRKQSLYRAPTNEELAELRENEDLYKNNLFRMQIQYLLEEVTVQEKKLQKINTVLHSLNAFLKDLPPQQDAYELFSDDVLPKNVSFPLPVFIPRSKLKGSFTFQAPTELKVIGSFLLKTTIKSNQIVDIAVEIPKDTLHGRDFLNFRYYYKRALYLTWLAHHLKEWEHTEDLQYSCACDAYKPTLNISLKGKVGQKWSIRIHTSIPKDAFKLNRYSPLKNNIRQTWYHSSEEEEDGSDFATPYYNNGILRDMLYESHLRDLYNAQKDFAGMKDAVSLVKVWLRQRSFKGASPFNGFVVSMLIVYLLSIRKISTQMSSYQIFRMILNFIASSDWTTEGISMCKDEKSVVSIADFHSVFDVVFVDSSGYLNLCAEVDRVTYEMVKYQAELSLEQLDSSNVNSFDCLFIKSHSFLQTVDHSMFLSNLEGCEKLRENDRLQRNLMDVGGDWTRLVAKQVIPLLKVGLDKRVDRIFLKPQKEMTWNVSSQRPCIELKSFCIGFHLNREHSDEVLVMGPPADQPQAKDFRAFWGEKSELRRFQDGSINEAVLWNCNNTTEKYFVCQRIIQYLLHIHLSIPSQSISYLGGEFDCILSNRTKRGCGEEEMSHVIKTFDELSKGIRTMEGVPLVINSINPVDAAIRCISAVTPMQYLTKARSDFHILHPKLGKKTPVYCPAFKALIQFETSGKWPDDLDAIQHIRAAFHLQMAKYIRQQLHLPAVATTEWIDVCKNGYVFRFTVVHYREMVLCKESTATGLSKKEHDLRAKKLDLLIVKSPLHHSLIHSLNSVHRSFALTTRLAKRWLASHMLSGWVSEEAVELICTHLFIMPAPYRKANSHMTGFLRFLDLMAKYDWQNEPLIVNLNDDLTKEERDGIIEHFTNNRDQLPAMFIATPYDKESSVWTKTIPDSLVLKRISMLANAALTLIDDQHVTEDIVRQLFRPSLNDFHAIIELNKNHVPRHRLMTDESSPGATKVCSGVDNVTNSIIPVTEFDPVSRFVKELQEAFCDVAMFFYDENGGVNVGVVWKQAALHPQSFKPLNAKYKHVCKLSSMKKKEKRKVPTLISTKHEVMPNFKAIISDFYVIGRGLVSNVIEIKTP